MEGSGESRNNLGNIAILGDEGQSSKTPPTAVLKELIPRGTHGTKFLQGNEEPS